MQASPKTQPRHRSFAVMRLEVRCILATMKLIAGRQLIQPRTKVGRVVTFADGSRSRVYRETSMRRRTEDDLVILAVRFRLRFIGSSPVWHWLFRIESLLNTLLFAAHPGFQTKLWMTDVETGFYRGIYEWRGAGAAREYAETLRVVLHPWVEPRSFAYRVIEGTSREAFLDGSAMASSEDRGWWRPVPAPQSHPVAR